MAAPSQFGAASVPGLNPAVIQQNPSFALQSMQAARQQAIAQALMQEGMAPIDYDNRGRISWAQGLAKMLQTYQGYKMGNDAIKQQAGLQTQGMQAMGPMYGFGGGSAPVDPQAIPQAAMTEGAKQGSVGPTNQNAALAAALQGRQASAAPASPAGAPLNPFGAPPMLAYMASQGDPAALEQLKTFGANATTTPEIKNNQWSGISPEQAKAMALSDATNKGFHAFNPGESWTNTFTGQGGFSPKVPDYSQPSAAFTPGSNIPSVSPVPGSQPVVQDNSRATATGATAGGVHTITNPDGSSSTGLGSDLFKIPPAVQAGRDSDALKILRQERAKPTNSPEDNAALDREIARAVGSRVATGPDPTVQAGRTDQQTEMGKRWASLSGLAGNAQKVNSYLDNIGSLADKAATGQFADRLQLTNSLLAPFSQRATDATTASNLLDKYSNQIVAQLGSGGGMSTDAARDILHSAYPNRSMNAPAIHEAVSALKAQSIMAQAKARILQPAYTSNDPVAYTKAETAFDQAADPRIFQWRAIADPAARRAFGAKIMAQDPSLAGKAKVLEQMGVQ